MQDLHSIEISGSSGQYFSIEGDGRWHHHDLKCPRCESLNTKFCYYNNYNLSQPRHFCRSCRRYWTKGGVLRNVPVGGGIRKAKRSDKQRSKTSIPSSHAVAADHKSFNPENSSSVQRGMTTMDVSRSISSTNSTPTMLLNFNEPSTRFFNFSQSSTQITTIDPLMMNQSSSARNILTENGIFLLQQQNQLQWTETDRMAEFDYTGNGGLAGNDYWQHSAKQGLFDLKGTLDKSYWSQNQWNDDDHDHHFSYRS